MHTRTHTAKTMSIGAEGEVEGQWWEGLGRRVSGV